MCFAGIWRDGVDDYYEYSDLSPEEIEEELPSVLDEMYGIADYKRDWLSEQDEEDEELEWPEPKEKE